MKTKPFQKQKFYCVLGVILLLLGTSAIRGRQLAANVAEAELLTTEIRQLGEVQTDFLGDSLEVGDLQLVSNALISETDSRTAAVPLSLSGAFTLRNSDSEELRYFHQDTDSAGGMYSTNKVLHKEVWDSADLFVTLNDQGMRENFILKDQQVPTQFDYVVETIDLELRINENGELQFADGDGQVEFSAAAPALTDAIGQQFAGTLQNEIVWGESVENVENVGSEEIVADEETPNDPNTPNTPNTLNNPSTSTPEEIVIEVVELPEEELAIEVIEIDEVELTIEIVEVEPEVVVVDESTETEEIEVVADEVIEETIEEEIVSEEAEELPEEETEIEEEVSEEITEEEEVDKKTAKKIANYLKQAEQKLAKDKFKQARSFVKKVLDLDSDNTEAQALSERIGQTEAAAIAAAQAKKIAGYLKSAEQKLAKSKFDQARNFAEKVFVLESDNTEAQALSGRIDQAEEEAAAAKVAEQKQKKEKNKKGKKQAALSRFLQAGKLLADLLNSQTEQEIFAESGASYEEVEQEDGSILRRYRLSLGINPELTDLLHYPLGLSFSTVASAGQDSAELNQHLTTESISYGTGFEADLSLLTLVQEEEEEALIFEIVPMLVANQNVVALSGGGGGGGASVASWIEKVDTVLSSTVTELESNSTETNFTTANVFTDVSEENVYASYINQLASEEVISGYEDGSFRPEGYLNRAELLKIALTAFDLELAESLAEQPFSDVPLDAWFAPFVDTAKRQGIVNGYADGSFLPERTINRVEAIKILLLASGLPIPADSLTTSFTDVPLDAWFAPLVSFVEKNGIAEGITKSVSGINASYKVFEPGGQVTRGEIARMAVLLGDRG